MSNLLSKKIKLSTFQTIILGFLGVLFLGTLMLMLPFSSSSNVVTPFDEALFTATSAVCVTGLVVHDTATYWSSFGQSIILLLIQIGGLGVVTVVASISLLSGRRITLMQRSTMQEAISAQKVGGIVRLTGFILKATFLFEFIGAVVLVPVFYKAFGLKGIWMAVFHSVSAFCNAGFDIMGDANSLFPSLTAFADNVIVNVAIMLLIIIGGIGFLTWDDIYTNKFNFKKYRMQSKVILVTSAILITVPAVYFYFAEYSALSLGERILSSIFQSVTTRTAGFNTQNLSAMGSVGQAIMIVLMLIGGSPGSTAGGLKTTTIAVLVSNAFSTFRKKENVTFFGRTVENSVVKNAATILMMYVMLFVSSGFVISLVDDIPLSACLFETASAVGTVGLTLGVTTKLSAVSRFIIIALMFFGRVGGLTLIYAAFSGTNKNVSRFPNEKITVG